MIRTRCARWRGPLLAATALVVTLSACTSGSSGAAEKPPGPASTTTPGPERPAPGTRFDGEDLPQPVSNLVVVDELVAYYAPDDEGNLQLVAVDPAEGEVRWTHEAAIPSWSTGSPIPLRIIEGVIPVFDKEAEGDDPYALVVVDPDGTTRSTNPIRRPVAFPVACRERVCVDTISGAVAVDPVAGEAEIAPDQPVGVLGTGDDQLLRRDPEARSRGGDQLENRPLFGAEPTWRRPVAEVFGFEQVTDGWATVVGDRWIVHALPREPREEDVAFPSTTEVTGTLAGVAMADGEPLWRRDAVGLCLFPVADDLVTTCGMTVTQASAEADEEVRIHAVGSVDPATGRDLIRVETLPYDTQAGDRYAVVGPDRLAVRTASGVHEVDLRKGTAKPTAPHRIAWCRPDGHLPEIKDNSGDLVEYTTAGQGRPCTVDASKISEDDLLAPIVDGTLPPVDQVSSVQVGPWVLWAEDGRLEGVATER